MPSSFDSSKNTVPSISTSSSSISVTSFEPAGVQHAIQESGANILDIFCNGFPETNQSSLIPSFCIDNKFESNEQMKSLSKKQPAQCKGYAIDQDGKNNVLMVLSMFIGLTRQQMLSPPLLVMREFKMDEKNSTRSGLKKQALASLLPNLNSMSFSTKVECDFLILVQNVGVVLVDVEKSNTESMVRSAENKLRNTNRLIQCIIKAISKDRRKIIPTVKLIVIPNDVKDTPEDPTQQQSYFVFKDMCDRFDEYWQTKVVHRLNLIRNTNPFSFHEFKMLSEILVGLWSSKEIYETQQDIGVFELKLDRQECLYSKEVRIVDKLIDIGNVRTKEQFKLQDDCFDSGTNIIHTNEFNMSRSSDASKLCYLTPDQKQLFCYCKQVMVRSPAGCGKSLLILLKVYELLKNPEFNSRILILAPIPHTLRIRKSLQSNNIHVEIIEKFPPLKSSTNAFIMDLESFFDDEHTSIIDYDLSNYHIFIDDLHNMTRYSNTTFFDLGDFLDRTYSICVKFDTYLWIMLDVVQGIISEGMGIGQHSQDLFFTPDLRPRNYNIPIVKLFHVMRSTGNIVKFHNEVRTKRIKYWKASSHGLPSSKIGNKIESQAPLYHRLLPSTTRDHKMLFVISRLREALETVTSHPFSLSLSNVAIIYDFEDDFKPYKADITSFLTNEIGTTPLTIEEQLTNNNIAGIVMDEMKNIMSFESPVVVFICTSGVDVHGSFYNICTRARVSLTIIDVDPSKFSFTYNNMDVVQWKPHLTEYSLSNGSGESDSDTSNQCTMFNRCILL